MRRVLGCLMAIAVGLTAAPVSAQTVEDSSIKIVSSNVDEFPDVTLRIRVTGEAALDDLSRASFEVRENGDRRTVKSVETAATEDLEVMVVFDRSGSMAGEPIAAAKAAVANFVDRLPDEVLVGLVSFSSQATLDVAPTLDRAAVRAGIDAIVATGRTALYDGIFLAADRFSGTKSRRLMVVLSDGGDNASLATLDDADARAEDVLVEVVELATPESNREALDRLVNPGPVRSVSSPADLDSVYGAVVDQLLSQVILTYESGAADGTEAVRVEVSLAGSTASSGKVEIAVPAPSPTTVPPIDPDTPTTVPTPGEDAAASPANTLFGGLLVSSGLLVVLYGLLGVRRRRLKHRLPGPVTPSWTTLQSRRKIWFRWLDGPRGEEISTALRSAGVIMPVEEFVVWTLVGTLGATAVLAIMAGPLGLFGLLTPWGVRTILRSRARARRDKFIAQLPDTLLVLAAMLRSGYGLVQALDAVARESDDPTGAWFDRVLLEVRTGRDLSDALRALSVEVQSVDFDWVVVAVEINRDVGGEMARTLESVAATVRERDKLRGQVRALTAEGRMSAYLMLSLPPITGLLTIFSNREYGKVLLEPVGLVLLAIAVLLMGVGWAWINRLIDKVAR